jgi:hypothetical protein
MSPREPVPFLTSSRGRVASVAPMAPDPSADTICSGVFGATKVAPPLIDYMIVVAHLLP